MIAVGKRERAEATCRHRVVGDFEWSKSEWMMTGDDPTLSPTVFMIEQYPHTILAAHCHHQNQFQLFVEGSGRIGSHAISALTIHYAGAYTGYGPIEAGPEGLAYMTLRPVYEFGALMLGQAKGRIPRGPKRGAQAGPIAMPALSDLGALNAPVSDVLIPRGEDGLAASLTRLPPHAPLDPVQFGGAQGVFLFVAAGSLRYDEQALEAWETLFMSADEDAAALSAGADGAAVLILFVPPRNPRYPQFVAERSAGAGI